ncbi:LysR family transcriptional regulator [Dulcicalothrix desertica PCC 7102]|uniref:LysR family transcriptional regulator n=1 Tax=Dulcicalothrix desertica PCC 7102 TaxID=232991 RepID=A0A433VFX3_9CYAN|nr:LysR family transcriptional regulator [Dulcicalothrix desertica]RUT04982.1 LysR family transcriptional regulator [Dulcicalothrix desertica PCC 7102]TWH43451.1 DNA-binding transcriptional LysR family regulator [Dulcicalothrix desertica PCC 7102]
MELRLLRYFVVVAEELHFGRAAERLHLTQPALSKQIVVLERELGVSLLTRTKRVVQLTVAGEVFLEQAKQLLTQTHNAIQLTQRTARGEIGQLKIGFTSTATYTVFPTLLKNFRSTFPNVELNLQELSTEAQVTALNGRQIDIAFLHPPIDERGLKIHSILEENFVAVLPKHHHLLEYEQIPLSAFASEPLIIHPRQEGPALYNGLIQLCQQLGFQPKIAQESISLQTRICLVTAGIGISFVSESVQSLVGTDVVCKPLANCPIKLKFAAAWRQDSSIPTLQEFLTILRANRAL